jgi:hypothetical protein
MTSIEKSNNNISNNNIEKKVDNVDIVEKNNISTEIITKKNNIKINPKVSFYDKYKNIFKIGFIILGIIIFLYFLYKMNMINFSFTNISLYNNKIQTKKNEREFEELTNNINSWNIEDEIEKLIKNQNIYIQEKKL